MLVRPGRDRRRRSQRSRTDWPTPATPARPSPTSSGMFKTVIDGIVLVLNAFAIIALLAASFGIVNTLLMSVQERTREIGLMKAMGMGSGKVFGLFSLEAAFIGFLGSAIGVGVAMLAGTGAQLRAALDIAPRRPAGPDAHRVRPGVDPRDHPRRDGDRVPRRDPARRARRASRSGRVAPLRVTGAAREAQLSALGSHSRRVES